MINNNNTIHYLKSGTELIIQQTPTFDVRDFIQELLEYLPEWIFSLIDSVYIGNFKDLNDRDVTALYLDGAIFVSNEQPTAVEAAKDVIHEFGHVLESQFPYEIYGDSEVKNEFFDKRLTLYYLMKTRYKCDLRAFRNVEFDEEFDQWLYSEIGYDTLNLLIQGIFFSPYSVTSVREYWAAGFEKFILGKKFDTIAPRLYNKIQDVLESITAQ